MDISMLMLSREVAKERVQTAQSMCSWYEAESQLYSKAAQKTMTGCWLKVWNTLRNGWQFAAYRYGWG